MERHTCISTKTSLGIYSSILIFVDVDYLARSKLYSLTLNDVRKVYTCQQWLTNSVSINKSTYY